MTQVIGYELISQCDRNWKTKKKKLQQNSEIIFSLLCGMSSSWNLNCFFALYQTPDGQTLTHLLSDTNSLISSKVGNWVFNNSASSVNYLWEWWACLFSLISLFILLNLMFSVWVGVQPLQWSERSYVTDFPLHLCDLTWRVMLGLFNILANRLCNRVAQVKKSDN